MTQYLKTLARVLDPVSALDRLPPIEPGRKLVLGSATNYELDDIKAFVLSLRAHFDGDVCLFVNRESEDLRAFLRAHAVEGFCVEDLPFEFGARVEFVRYAYFLWYLRQSATLPEAVLMTDTRDVVFQGPPFPDDVADTVQYYTEANDVPLRDHPTGRWLVSTFGRDVASLLGEKPCICCGTIIGRGDRIVQFLGAMLPLGAIPRFAQARSFGIDQAITNYIAYFDMLGTSVVNPNGGNVATLGMVAPGALRISGTNVYNADGSLSPIVHQYDRHPKLWNAVVDRYHLGKTRRMVEAEENNRGDLARKLDYWRWEVLRRIPELR